MAAFRLDVWCLLFLIQYFWFVVCALFVVQYVLSPLDDVNDLHVVFLPVMFSLLPVGCMFARVCYAVCLIGHWFNGPMIAECCVLGVLFLVTCGVLPVVWRLADCLMCAALERCVLLVNRPFLFVVCWKLFVVLCSVVLYYSLLFVCACSVIVMIDSLLVVCALFTACWLVSSVTTKLLNHKWFEPIYIERS